MLQNLGNQNGNILSTPPTEDEAVVLQREIDALSDRTSNNENDITDIKNRLDVDECQINCNKDHIDAIYECLADITPDITDLENRVCCNETDISNLSTCPGLNCTGTLVQSDIADFATCAQVHDFINECGYTTCTGTLVENDINPLKTDINNLKQCPGLNCIGNITSEDIASFVDCTCVKDIISSYGYTTCTGTLVQSDLDPLETRICCNEIDISNLQQCPGLDCTGTLVQSDLNNYATKNCVCSIIDSCGFATCQCVDGVKSRVCTLESKPGLNCIGDVTTECLEACNYTTCTGTVTSVNNIAPINGNVTLTIPPDLTDQVTCNTNDITSIKSKIPNAASCSNQLADKDWVNSTVSTETANFMGTYSCVEELPTTGVTNNDYAFVTTTNTTTGQITYTRYKYTSRTSSWVCEYDLNTSGFTADQLAAINSGITDTLVSKITDVYDNTVTLCMNGLCKGSFNLNQSVNCTIDLGNTNSCFNVYCNSTCKCTVNNNGNLCLKANAFNDNATISTDTYPGACCVGTVVQSDIADFIDCQCVKDIIDSCGVVTIANSTASTNIPIALCTGTTCVGKSTACSLSYNPATGNLNTCSVNDCGRITYLNGTCTTERYVLLYCEKKSDTSYTRPVELKGEIGYYSIDTKVPFDITVDFRLFSPKISGYVERCCFSNRFNIIATRDTTNNISKIWAKFTGASYLGIWATTNCYSKNAINTICSSIDSDVCTNCEGFWNLSCYLAPTSCCACTVRRTATTNNALHPIPLVCSNTSVHSASIFVTCCDCPQLGYNPTSGLLSAGKSVVTTPKSCAVCLDGYIQAIPNVFFDTNTGSTITLCDMICCIQSKVGTMPAKIGFVCAPACNINLHICNNCCIPLSNTIIKQVNSANFSSECQSSKYEIINNTDTYYISACTQSNTSLSITYDGHRTNATCFNGCTYSQACNDIRNGLVTTTNLNSCGYTTCIGNTVYETPVEGIACAIVSTSANKVGPIDAITYDIDNNIVCLNTELGGDILHFNTYCDYTSMTNISCGTFLNCVCDFDGFIACLYNNGTEVGLYSSNSNNMYFKLLSEEGIINTNTDIYSTGDLYVCGTLCAGSISGITSIACCLYPESVVSCSAAAGDILSLVMICRTASYVNCCSRPKIVSPDSNYLLGYCACTATLHTTNICLTGNGNLTACCMYSCCICSNCAIFNCINYQPAERLSFIRTFYCRYTDSAGLTKKAKIKWFYNIDSCCEGNIGASGFCDAYCRYVETAVPYTCNLAGYKMKSSDIFDIFTTALCYRDICNCNPECYDITWKGNSSYDEMRGDGVRGPKASICMNNCVHPGYFDQVSIYWVNGVRRMSLNVVYYCWATNSYYDYCICFNKTCDITTCIAGIYGGFCVNRNTTCIWCIH